jgi:hypothetical protein
MAANEGAVDWRAVYESSLQEYELRKERSGKRLREMWAQEARAKSSRSIQAGAHGLLWHLSYLPLSSSVSLAGMPKDGNWQVGTDTILIIVREWKAKSRISGLFGTKSHRSRVFVEPAPCIM